MVRDGGAGDSEPKRFISLLFWPPPLILVEHLRRVMVNGHEPNIYIKFKTTHNDFHHAAQMT